MSNEKEINSSPNRTSLLKKNIIFSFLIKGWSAAIVFIMLPLTLKMLGPYNNGVWLTISSILVWIDLLDIGLGNGMRNAVAKHCAEGNHEKVKETVSSTLFMLLCVIGVAFLILFPIVCLGDMNGMLGIDFNKVPELNSVLSVALLFVGAALILKFIGNLYLGLQLPAVNNLIICLGQTVALVGTAIAWLLDCHSLSVVVFINVASPFFIWLISYPLTFRVLYPKYRPTRKSVNLSTAKSLCSTGMQFFVLQICSLVLFASTNIIISRLISPIEVTTYQTAFRYFSIVMVLFTIVCMPFWNATTDAYSRGDIEWIRRASRKMNLMMLLIFAGLILMLLLSDFVYKIWMKGVEVPISLSIGMAAYQMILILSMRYSYFLNGIGILRIQLVFTVLATVIFLPLAWGVCTLTHSVSYLVAVMCLVNIPGLIANVWKFNNIITGYGK